MFFDKNFDVPDAVAIKFSTIRNFESWLECSTYIRNAVGGGTKFEGIDEEAFNYIKYQLTDSEIAAADDGYPGEWMGASVNRVVVEKGTRKAYDAEVNEAGDTDTTLLQLPVAFAPKICATPDVNYEEETEEEKHLLSGIDGLIAAPADGAPGGGTAVGTPIRQADASADAVTTSEGSPPTPADGATGEGGGALGSPAGPPEAPLAAVTTPEIAPTPPAEGDKGGEGAVGSPCHQAEASTADVTISVVAPPPPPADGATRGGRGAVGSPGLQAESSAAAVTTTVVAPPPLPADGATGEGGRAVGFPIGQPDASAAADTASDVAPHPLARKADASADEIKTPMVAMDSPPMAPGSLYKLCSSPSPHGSDVTSLEVAKAPSPVPLPRSLSFGTEPGGGVVPGSPVFKMFVQNHFLKNGVIWYNIVLEAGAEPIPVKYKHNYKTSSAIIEYNEKNLQQPSGVTTAPSKEQKKPPVKRMLGFTIEGGVLTQKTIPISSDSWRYEPLEFDNGVSAGTGVPKVAAPGVSEEPASGSPVVPAPCIPEVPATGVPEVPAPGVPEASASGVF